MLLLSDMESCAILGLLGPLARRCGGEALEIAIAISKDAPWPTGRPLGGYGTSVMNMDATEARRSLRLSLAA